MVRKTRFGIILLAALMLCSMVAPVYAAEKLSAPKVSFKTRNKANVYPGANPGIEVTLSSPGFVTVTLEDEEGNLMMTILEDEERSSGPFVLSWDGKLDGGAIPEEGTYRLVGVLRNELGEESDPQRQKIIIQEPAPVVENLQFSTYDNGDWKFTFTVEEPGSLWVDLHSARDLDHAMFTIIEGDHEGGEISVGWDTVVNEYKEKKETIVETIYPGRYAVKAYSKNKADIESAPAILFITVDNDGRAYVVDEEGTDSAAAAPVQQQTAAPSGTNASAAVPIGDTTADGPEAAADDAAGEATPAGNSTTVVSDALGIADGAATPAAARVQLGQSIGSVSLVAPEDAQVGKGVSDYVQQPADNYWNLETGSLDDAAIWSALIKPMYVCKIDESDHFYLLDAPDRMGKRLGEMHGETSAVNVLYENKDGWALAEGYDNEDSAFIRGWVQMSRLREVTPDQTYGLVLDKRAQTLTLYHEGQQVDTIKVSTGLADAKNTVRETPAGEFILGTRIGTKEQGVIGTCDYHIRVQGGILMHGQPYKGKDTAKTYEWGDKLGTKSTRNTIVVQSEPNDGQEFCMEYVWSKLPRNMKILILDDKPRSEVLFK